MFSFFLPNLSYLTKHKIYFGMTMGGMFLNIYNGYLLYNLPNFTKFHIFSTFVYGFGAGVGFLGLIHIIDIIRKKLNDDKNFVEFQKIINEKTEKPHDS